MVTLGGAENWSGAIGQRHSDEAKTPTKVTVSEAALFLDLDGTLAPFEHRPDGVGPDRRRRDVLARARVALQGRIAIISGRAITDLDRILECDIVCVAGTHGLERRITSGAISRFASADTADTIDGLKQAAAALLRDYPGILLEDKGLSLAIHYRNAPEARAAVIAFAAHHAQARGLRVQHGTLVAELRVDGPDKGDAISAFMREIPFAGATPLFVGDDLTDEDGFAKVAQLCGVGVLVGPKRETRASWRLESPQAVLTWIDVSLARGYFEAERGM